MVAVPDGCFGSVLTQSSGLVHEADASARDRFRYTNDGRLALQAS
jgi:hypothetical protein